VVLQIGLVLLFVGRRRGGAWARRCPEMMMKLKAVFSEGVVPGNK